MHYLPTSKQNSSVWTCVCHNSCYSQDLVTHADPLTLYVLNMQQSTRDSATVETRPHVTFQSTLKCCLLNSFSWP